MLGFNEDKSYLGVKRVYSTGKNIQYEEHIVQTYEVYTLRNILKWE